MIKEQGAQQCTMKLSVCRNGERGVKRSRGCFYLHDSVAANPRSKRPRGAGGGNETEWESRGSGSNLHRVVVIFQLRESTGLFKTDN